MEHRLSCPAACGIFLDQGLNLCPLHWQVDSQPLHLQGNPTETYIYRKEHDFFKGMTLPFQKLFLFFALLEETSFTPQSPVQLGSLPQPRGLNFSLFLNPPRASGSPPPLPTAGQHVPLVGQRATCGLHAPRTQEACPTGLPVPDSRSTDTQEQALLIDREVVWV